MERQLPHNLDLAALHILHALLEEGGPTRAARRLGVSQPAVSRALARLRVAFNDPLLIRKLGGMVPTPRAQALKGPLSRWLADGEALLRKTVPPEQLNCTFVIASTDYGVMCVVAPFLKKLSRMAPDVKLRLVPLSEVSSRQLAEGEIDLMITGFDPDPSLVHSRHLFQEMHLALARAGHPIFDAPSITADAFLSWKHVAVSVLGQELGSMSGSGAGLTAHIAQISTTEFSLVPLLVQASDALAILPARAAKQFQCNYEIKLFSPPIQQDPFDYWLVWHERIQRDPAVMWLIDQLAAPFEAGDVSAG